MPHLLALIREDVATVLERDPAAKSHLEVYLCYSGLHAVWLYRMNHWLWNHNFLLLARWLSQVARWLTGIRSEVASGGLSLLLRPACGLALSHEPLVVEPQFPSAGALVVAGGALAHRHQI